MQYVIDVDWMRTGVGYSLGIDGLIWLLLTATPGSRPRSSPR
jgi:hypothetical protein